MGKFRYLIERGMPEKVFDGNELVEADLFITTITPDDDTGRSGGQAFRTLDAAKAEAEQLHRSDGSEDVPLKWKDPPQAWQPDALAVSQYLDDGIEDNRD